MKNDGSDLFSNYPPIMTIGFPGGIILPTGPGIGATQEVCAVMSLMRAEGNMLAFTVMEPFTIIPGPPAHIQAANMVLSYRVR